MENHHFPCWPAAPAEANWAQTSAAVYDESFFIPDPSHASANFQVNGFPSWAIPIQEASEDKAASSSRSHSQAEKRRRDRISAQLGILRKLIPKSEKMDKAALLGSAIDHVKNLKQKASEISRTFTVPSEVDEVTVDCDVPQLTTPPGTNKDKDKDNTFIRASVCCNDRPELFSELITVLKGLRLAIVRADIASVGGRVKSILILCSECSEEGSVSISTIKQSLNLVLSRIASPSMPSNYRIRSKRQRFFLPPRFSEQ